MKNRFLIYIILIFINSSFLNANERVIFEIDNEIYTSIDLKKRIEYLKNINIEKNNEEIIKDFKSIIFFDVYAKNNNINITDEQINEYLSKINNITDKNNIIQNLRYDLQRKKILEKYLWIKNLNIEKNFSDFSNVYDFNFEYIIIDNKFYNNVDLSKILLLNKLDLIINELNIKKIKYSIYKKNINDLDKLDKRIKEKINISENVFLIEYQEFYLIGIINKKLKKGIELKLTFYQITANNELDKNSIFCNNINELTNNKSIEIKKFSKIEIEKLHPYLQNNLVTVEDLIINKKDSQIIDYILLCEVTFDKNLLNDLVYNKKIENIVNQIEESIISKIQNEYNFVEYE